MDRLEDSLGHGEHYSICRFKIVSHDSSLILQDLTMNGVGDNVEVFVSKIQAARAWEVAQEIHRSIKVRNSDNFSANKVIETVDCKVRSAEGTRRCPTRRGGGGWGTSKKE